MKRNAGFFLTIVLYIVSFACQTKTNNIPSSQYKLQDSLRCDALLNKSHSTTDRSAKETIIKDYTQKSILFSTNDADENKNLLPVKRSFDYSIQSGKIQTVEGAGQMHDCRLDKDAPTITPFELKRYMYGSKKMNWEIASQDQHTWTVTSQEKCYFRKKGSVNELAKVIHIGSWVNSIDPARWEEKYNYVKNIDWGIEARCGGLLTVSILNLPGESFIKRYELLNSIVISSMSIEKN